MPWLENANNLPEIIRHLNENMIAAAYVVHSPQEYWTQKEQQIREMNQEWTDAQVYKEIERLRDEVTKTIANVMAGQKNAGKFFSCVDFLMSWGMCRAGRLSLSR